MGNLSTAKGTSRAGEGYKQNATLGFVAVICGSFSSGLAAVSFEKLVKNGQQSLWLRNIYLSVFSLAFGALTACTTARQDLAEKGFFYGFDGVVVCVILINSIGGM